MLVVGHTDSTGSAAHNMALSVARAEAVRDYLMTRGIDGSRLKFSGRGPFEPAADNDTAQGRAMNRRVEFRWSPQGRWQAVVPPSREA